MHFGTTRIWRHVIVVSLSYVLFTVCCFADEIQLNDGRTFKGRLVGESEVSVTIDAMVSGIRATLTFKRENINTVVREEVGDEFFEPVPAPDAPDLISRTQDTPVDDPETAAWRAKFTAEDEARVVSLIERLAALQRELSEYRRDPDKLVPIPVPAGASVDDLLRSVGRRGVTQEQARQQHMRALQQTIATMQQRLAAARETLDQTRRASMQELAPRVEEAERHGRLMQRVRNRFNQPAKAADWAINDLLTKGELRNAVALERVEVLRSNVDDLYRGLLNPAWGEEPVYPAARLFFHFSFITQAGLHREHVGHVTVGLIDGIWRPFAVQIDGVGGPDAVYPNQHLIPLWLAEAGQEEALAKQKELSSEQEILSPSGTIDGRNVPENNDVGTSRE